MTMAIARLRLGLRVMWVRMVSERKLGASEVPWRALSDVIAGAERRCNLYPRSAFDARCGQGSPR
jgi:hypothetical protein